MLQKGVGKMCWVYVLYGSGIATLRLKTSFEALGANERKAVVCLKALSVSLRDYGDLQRRP